MEKDYKSWHTKKEKINNLELRPFFHEREIWFCFIGANIGFEQDGQGKDFQRPVIIVKKFNNEICWAVSLSKTKKRGEYYFAFPFNDKITSVAILSQIKLIDVERLSRKIGDMDENNFCVLVEKLKALFP
ncbi:MAG: type II toxin-antitoxin system PemK/MazF family toxin [Candidatus Paceibacterota bacterium]